jgi:hypothetical protein
LEDDLNTGKEHVKQALTNLQDTAKVIATISGFLGIVDRVLEIILGSNYIRSDKNGKWNS